MKNELELLLENFVAQGEQEIVDLAIFRQFAQDEKNFTRETMAHFTASAFVLNEKRDKVLGIFHRIYQSWGWLGGHADGDTDLVRVARKEVQEESGLTDLKLLSSAPISIENLPVFGHFHRTHGYVSAHLHLNVTFLFEAKEGQKLRENRDETGGLAWIALDEFSKKSSEKEMKVIYDKIILRIKKDKEDKK
ncbi:NUDIX hydrolase [Lactococcus kimchii]|uniref:NUDIX hydrolase n=1 Tax=Lactococcus sp. S-13 TaxID=2507158 RepID=UPI001022D45A|nr:NUDIX hydrolase [Lactococcus sp. S-13]RZI49106.1 NUDIX domain-containing protein [Lactococcus sp. S-13]